MSFSVNKWGYLPETSNLIEPDKNDKLSYLRIIETEPTLRACMFCGTCRATCSSGVNGMNFMRIHLLLQRGESAKIKEIIPSCLLCSKCATVCPRGVNTRKVLFNLKMQLHEF
ncbi:MAG: (Fe-S)-binding protein [Prolixibacteraceae bacterium]|nr:(Fe-S)-binding protein [Prolixibacteraceae bacterium]